MLYFPPNPASGQVHSYGEYDYVFDGDKWNAIGVKDVGFPANEAEMVADTSLRLGDWIKVKDTALDYTVELSGDILLDNGFYAKVYVPTRHPQDIAILSQSVRYTDAGGGTNVSGEWTGRKFNHITVNTLGVLVSEDSVTIPAGEYAIHGTQVFDGVGAAWCRLYDNTNHRVIVDGTPSDTSGHGKTQVDVLVNFTAPTNVSLQYITDDVVDDTGLGRNDSPIEVSVATLVIERSNGRDMLPGSISVNGMQTTGHDPVGTQGLLQFQTGSGGPRSLSNMVAYSTTDLVEAPAEAIRISGMINGGVTVPAIHANSGIPLEDTAPDKSLYVQYSPTESGMAKAPRVVSSQFNVPDPEEHLVRVVSYTGAGQITRQALSVNPPASIGGTNGTLTIAGMSSSLLLDEALVYIGSGKPPSTLPNGAIYIER